MLLLLPQSLLTTTTTGVLVGINTVIFDHPRLNVRDPLPDTYSITSSTNNIINNNQPRPIIIDSNLKILDLDVSRYTSSSSSSSSSSLISFSIRLVNPIICTCVSTNDDRWHQASNKLSSIGITLVNTKADDDGRCDIIDCLKCVKKQCNIQSILVEGGANIIQSTLEYRLANQIVLTLRPSFFGGYKSMTKQLPVPVELENITVASIEGDIVIHGIVSKKIDGTTMNVDENQQTRERVTLQ
jgi:riboflavin biosynthesis pyrimidine reductase